MDCCSGRDGYQLTWMDAKMGDWVVTPRRGKAVEINALWYNALRLIADWLRASETNTAARYDKQRRLHDMHSINVSGLHRAVIFTTSSIATAKTERRPIMPAKSAFRHLARSPGAGRKHWASVIEMAQKKLLTPVGLRSLSPDDPEYKPIYGGDLRSRDGAYHQGTVWAWLIGPFIDAWLSVHPDDKSGARKFLEVFPRI